MDARRFGEGNVRQVEEKQPGAAGKDHFLVAWAKLMRGHSFGIDKIEGEGARQPVPIRSRQRVAAGLCESGKTSPYNKANLIDAFRQTRAFPDWKALD